MTFFVLFAGALALLAVAVLAVPLLGRRGEAGGSKAIRFAAIAAAGLMPLAAALIYSQIGAPAALNPVNRVAVETPAEDPAAAIAALPPEERNAMIQNMVEGLATRLEENPDDIDGWRMLARSYGTLGRHKDATDAWREALAASNGAVDDWRGLATSLIEEQAPDNANGPAIKEAMEEVLAQAPDDALALYFLGHAERAAGNNERALELWTRLRVLVPDEAPFKNDLDKLIAEVSADQEPG